TRATGGRGGGAGRAGPAARSGEPECVGDGVVEAPPELADPEIGPARRARGPVRAQGDHDAAGEVDPEARAREPGVAHGAGRSRPQAVTGGAGARRVAGPARVEAQRARAPRRRGVAP